MRNLLLFFQELLPCREPFCVRHHVRAILLYRCCCHDHCSLFFRNALLFLPQHLPHSRCESTTRYHTPHHHARTRHACWTHTPSSFSGCARINTSLSLRSLRRPLRPLR